MRKFIQRALNKLAKLDKQQIHTLIYDLARENEQMEMVLDSLTDGVLVADQNNQIIVANKAVKRLLPINDHDSADKVLWEILADADIAAFVQETIENEERVLDREFTLHEPRKILAVSIIPLVRVGQVRGNLLHVTDISEKRLRETRLRRAENLASLTNLAAGVAHEIKNPLGSIGIHIQLIQRILAGTDNAENDYNADVHKHLKIVNEEIERLNHIVMDFLFAVRPINIDLEDHDLNALLQEIMRFLQYELQEADIELVENYQRDIPHILLDEKFMKQALLNIVKNAINAMPDGGRITIMTCCQGDTVQLNISDTGIGMSAELMKKVFDPYFTTKEFGSGIGLTIVYKIIKEHRGDISVSSQEGKGSSFLFSFPTMLGQRNLIGNTIVEKI